MDLVKTWESGDYDALIEYAENNQRYLISEWEVGDVPFLQKAVRFGMSVLHYFEQYLQENAKLRSIFRLGALMGSVESFDQLLYERRQDDWISKTYKEEVSSIKHLEDIILALEIHGIMSHSDICEYLGLKESNLSEIMKKVNLTNLISSSKSGKYKLYRLTDSGRRLGKQIRKQNDENISEKELLFQLQHYVESTKNKEEFKRKINGIMEYDRIVENKKSKIESGDRLKIYYQMFERRIIMQEFEIIGISDNDKRDDKELRIMAKMKKSEMFENNYNRQEEYA
jgi:Mn-dependent DtxR family transcriptional regulator